MSSRSAIDFFNGLKEEYKVELINDLGDEQVSLYTQGNFTDLCRGPHIPSTGMIKAFHLTKVAGAYWRGDEKRSMLSRIYGTAFPDKKSLKKYLTRLEEAKKTESCETGRATGHFQHPRRNRRRNDRMASEGRHAQIYP